MTGWPSTAMRLLGALDATLVLVGGGFLVRMVFSTADSSPPTFASPDYPFALHFFVGFVGANLLFLSGLAAAAWHLVRSRRRGLYLMGGTLLAEMVYVKAATTVLMSTKPEVGMSAAFAFGIGNMGMGPQFLVGYPMTGLLVAALLLWVTRSSSTGQSAAA